MKKTKHFSFALSRLDLMKIVCEHLEIDIDTADLGSVWLDSTAKDEPQAVFGFTTVEEPE